MPEASPDPVALAARWVRRDVLRLGLAVPVLAGCSASPAVSPLPGGSRPGAPLTPGAASPAPAPSVPAAATAEQQLSARAGAVLTGPHRNDLSGNLRGLLTFVRDAHADHAVALAGDDPTSRPTSAAPSPSAAPPNLKSLSLVDSLKGLARGEVAQAAAQRQACVAATGLAALLAGSLAVAADMYAAALGAPAPPPVSEARAHRAAPLLTDVAAAQQLVGQLRAMVFGYQLAIGKLTSASKARGRAVVELAAARGLLDDRIAFLLDRQADVPVAEPAYAASPDPRTSGDAGHLVRDMQTRLEPYVGITLAAAGSAGTRTSALTLLGSTTRTAGTWGAALQVWPGWPD